VLDLRRLRLLYELNSRGTLAEVARAVHQTPSAVSQQLAQLELETGVKLLQRVGRGVRLTQQAEILVGHAGVVLDRLERAEAEMASSLTTVTGSLRIAVFQSAAIALMPAFLSAMSKEYPELSLDLIQSENSVAQHEAWSREFDLMLTHRYPGESGVASPEVDEQPLVTDELRLAVPRQGSPWSQATSLADVSDAPWTMETRAISSGRWAQDACRRAGFEPSIRFELTDLHAQAALIAAGHAVGIFPDLFARRFSDSIRLVDLPDHPRRQILTFVRRSLAGSPLISACREVLSRVATLQLAR